MTKTTKSDQRITEEWLLEISERCHLGFRPMTNEPLGEQKHRVILSLEGHISFLLEHLQLLDETLVDDSYDEDTA